MAYLDQTASQYYSDENNIYGQYQFVSLEDIIKQFMIVYVGENKIIPKAKRLDVSKIFEKWELVSLAQRQSAGITKG